MKKIHLSIAPLLLCLLLFPAGCATVLPGNDAVVVDAERTTVVAADAFDTFLKSEYQTRAALRAASPATYAEVHSFAEYLRAPVSDNGAPGILMARAKQWLKSARTLTVAYKTNRTPENKANLDTILATITAAVAEAQKYLLRTQSVHN